MWHAPFHTLRTHVQRGFSGRLKSGCGPAFTGCAESPKRCLGPLVDPSPRGPKPKPGAFIFANSSPSLAALLKCLALSEVLNFWDHNNVSILWC
jgi:hypothetical protein